MRMNLYREIQAWDYLSLMWDYRDVVRKELAGFLQLASKSRPLLRGSWQKVPRIRPSYCTAWMLKVNWFLITFKKNFTFVNGPANLHSPPKPHDWRKSNDCCEASSDASIFWIMLCAAAKTTWSFDCDKTLLIFWSRSEWLNYKLIN